MLVSPVSVANVKAPGMNRNSKPSFGSEAARGGSISPDPVLKTEQEIGDAFAERMAKQHKVPKKLIMIALATLLAAGVALSAAMGYIQNLFGSSKAEVPVNQPGIVEELPGYTNEDPGFIIPSEEPTKNPTETPVVSETPGVTDPSSKPTETPKYVMPAYDKEKKAELDESIAHYSNVAGIDIESTIEDVHKKYGQFINVNMTEDTIRVGIITGANSSYYGSKGANLTGISPDAVSKVNDFLSSQGEEPLDPKDPAQNIAALWLAVSLYYDPDYSTSYPCDDIARPFGLARADSKPDDAERNSNRFWTIYVNLYGGPFVLEEEFGNT